jgi:hypothetical protein
MVSALPLPASAWNIPGHMLSGIIAYQILQQEKPQTIEKVKVVLEKHPWYANQWQVRLQDVPAGDRGLVLLMQADGAGFQLFASRSKKQIPIISFCQDLIHYIVSHNRVCLTR